MKMYQMATVKSEVFAGICDGQMIESTRNYNAENDVDFKEFITDLRIVKMEVDQILKHMERLSVENLYVGRIRPKKLSIVNGCKKKQQTKVILLLIIICKKTMTINKTDELKNNEEFESINVDNKTITIKNDRLNVVITHQQFNHFDLSYCITTHVTI